MEDLLSGKRSTERAGGGLLTGALCPGLTADWETRSDDALNWEMVYLPVRPAPGMFGRWSGLCKFPNAGGMGGASIIYENDLKIPYAISPMFEECRAKSTHWRVVGHVIGCEIPEYTSRDLPERRP